MSLPAKEKGVGLLRRLMAQYPALPVVNENLEVIGVVSEHDILFALKEGKTINEFDAETIMGCGETGHEEIYGKPITVNPDTSIDEIVDKLYSYQFTILPVVDDGKKLVGLISRKDIISSLAEEGLWPEGSLKKVA